MLQKAYRLTQNKYTNDSINIHGKPTAFPLSTIFVKLKSKPIALPSNVIPFHSPPIATMTNVLYPCSIILMVHISSHISKQAQRNEIKKKYSRFRIYFYICMALGPATILMDSPSFVFFFFYFSPIFFWEEICLQVVQCTSNQHTRVWPLRWAVGADSGDG